MDPIGMYKPVSEKPPAMAMMLDGISIEFETIEDFMVKESQDRNQGSYYY
jgi:hypothetical protein